MPAEKPTMTVRLPSGAEKSFGGRLAYMLRKLIDSGERGVSTNELPAGLRVSHYVFRLRREGVGILTKDEPHTGDFAGTHARYKLAVNVQVLSDAGRAAA